MFICSNIPLGLYFYRLKPSLSNVLIVLLVYIITFFSEWIGVNYGWLFGSYVYGESLGFKIGGVPLLIGANWLLLALVCYFVLVHWAIAWFFYMMTPASCFGSPASLDFLFQRFLLSKNPLTS